MYSCLCKGTPAVTVQNPLQPRRPQHPLLVYLFNLEARAACSYIQAAKRVRSIAGYLQ